MNRWRYILAICTLALVALLAFSSKSVEAAGLSYREILHFYVQDGKPYVNQSPPSEPYDHVAEYAVSLDFSGDGKTLAVGYGGIVRLWDIAAGTLQKEFSLNLPPYNPISQLDFAAGTRLRYSPDGRMLAVTALDELRIYTGETISMRCPGFTDTPFAWSPDSKFIAGGNENRNLTICNAATGETRDYNIHTTAVEWSPNGKYLLTLADTANATNYLRLFNVETNQIELVLLGSASIAWRPNSAEFINMRWVRSIYEGAIRLEVLGRGGNAVDWHPSGRRLAILDDRSIGVYDADTAKGLATISFETRGYRYSANYQRWVVWNRTGTNLAAIDALGTVYIWEESGSQPFNVPLTNTLRPTHISATWTPVPVPTKSFTSILPSKIMQQLKGVTTFGWEKPATASTPPYYQPAGAFMLSYEPNRQEWRIARRETPKQTLYVLAHTMWVSGLKVISWSPDGRYLAYVEDEANVRIFDLQTYQVVASIHHLEQVIEIVWHPSRPFVLTFSQDYLIGSSPMVIVYDLEARRNVYAAPVFLGLGPQLAWSGTSNTFIMWGVDAGIFTVDVASGKKTIIRDRIGWLMITALSPDGHYLAFLNRYAEKPTIYFFDMEQRKIVHQLAYPASIYKLEWKPDGQQIAIVDDNNTLTIWGN